MTQGLTKVSGADLAIGIQFSSQVGKDRHLTLTTGVPLDWDAAAINRTLDKLAVAMDRQALRYMLKDLKQYLVQRETELLTNRKQQEETLSRAESDWRVTGRRGDFKPQGATAKALENYEKTERALEEHIKRLRQDITEIEEQVKAA